MDPVLDKCPTCIQAKQVKEPAGKNTTRVATRPFQGLSIDFAFAGVKSSDDKRKEDFTGIHGETCWILISDHFSRTLVGDTRVSKGPPIEWLRAFLEEHAPRANGNYVYLDQGGELYANQTIKDLFEGFKYDVRPTGAESSNQNGPVERAHLTVANALRAMMLGASVDMQFWPYAFHHYLRIQNALRSRDQTRSPHEIVHSDAKEDFRALRTFGCRVWVRPPGRRRLKLQPNSRKGIFLGFIPNTTKNILWYDIESQKVKIAKHARFDEGMNDLPFDAIPPNVQHLQRSQQGATFPSEEQETSVEEFTAYVNPFCHTFNRTLRVTPTNSSTTFGLSLKDDEINHRVFVDKVSPNSSASKLFSTTKATNNRIKGAYIIAINDILVFSKSDAVKILQQLFDNGVKEFDISFAPDKRLTAKELRRTLRDHREPNIFAPNDPSQQDELSISLEDIRSIASLQSGLLLDHREIDLELLSATLHALSSDSITAQEAALGSFTRRKLKKLSTWPQWQQGEFKQLDQFAALNMYGEPCKALPNAIILRQHWQYHVKRSGERRARNCCDGSPRSAPMLHQIASTYSSCVEQPIQRLFFALAANLGYSVYGGDAQDAYAHSPPPDTPTFVQIDDAYAEWYFARRGKRIDRSLVLPVQHALQGHPESGRLWESTINKILSCDQLQFTSTTHSRTIYSTAFEGHQVLLLRQVDDFALACPNETIAKTIYDIIGTALQLPDEPAPPSNTSDLSMTSMALISTNIKDTLKLQPLVTFSAFSNPMDGILLMPMNPPRPTSPLCPWMLLIPSISQTMALRKALTTMQLYKTGKVLDTEPY
jgi:hypothetical protein